MKQAEVVQTAHCTSFMAIIRPAAATCHWGEGRMSMRNSVAAEGLHQQEGAAARKLCCSFNGWAASRGTQTSLGRLQMPDRGHQKAKGLDGLKFAQQIAAVAESQPGRPQMQRHLPGGGSKPLPSHVCRLMQLQGCVWVPAG